jgi:hypothetical protein
MTEARRKVSYATRFLPVIGYPVLMAWYLCRNPPDFMFVLIAGVLFYALYVVPLTLVQGKIEPTDRGVSVERWSKWSIEYSDVVACYGLFLIPFHIAILVTCHKATISAEIRCHGRRDRRPSPIPISSAAGWQPRFWQRRLYTANSSSR